MNELRNDQELTTADIANPQRGRESRSAVIDAHPVSSQTYPSGDTEHRRTPYLMFPLDCAE